MKTNNQINEVTTSKVLEIGETYKVNFTSYTHDGLAVAKINTVDKDGNELINYPVFVSGALVNESGLIEITKINKTFAYANLVKLFYETKSPYRIKPVCAYYGLCGGCNIMHMNYLGQLLFKEEVVKETLQKIGGFNNLVYNPIIGLENNQYNYRNKVQVPVGLVKDKMNCGFYKQGTHYIIPLDECYIQTELSTEIIKFIKNVLKELGATPYNEYEKTGDIRHILLRKSNDESQIMIVIVATKKDFFDYKTQDIFVEKVSKRYQNIKSIVINVNTLPNNVILGSQSITMYGKPYIIDTLCGIKFKIGPKSFYQVNHKTCEVLYNTAINLANLKKTDVVIDAYCGIGTIGLISAKHVQHVYGVEIVEEAINNAIDNAKLNNISNVTFVANKAETQIVKWMNESLRPNVVFVDPPRKGCEEVFLETIEKMKIEKIVYISCYPSTLARDLKHLCSNGYKIEIVQPVDMFPQTNHVETIVYLCRK